MLKLFNKRVVSNYSNNKKIFALIEKDCKTILNGGTLEQVSQNKLRKDIINKTIMDNDNIAMTTKYNNIIPSVVCAGLCCELLYSEYIIGFSVTIASYLYVLRLQNELKNQKIINNFQHVLPTTYSCIYQKKMVDMMGNNNYDGFCQSGTQGNHELLSNLLNDGKEIFSSSTLNIKKLSNNYVVYKSGDNIETYLHTNATGKIIFYGVEKIEIANVLLDYYNLVPLDKATFIFNPDKGHEIFFYKE